MLICFTCNHLYDTSMLNNSTKQFLKTILRVSRDYRVDTIYKTCDFSLNVTLALEKHNQNERAEKGVTFVRGGVCKCRSWKCFGSLSAFRNSTVLQSSFHCLRGLFNKQKFKLKDKYDLKLQKLRPVCMCYPCVVVSKILV